MTVLFSVVYTTGILETYNVFLGCCVFTVFACTVALIDLVSLIFIEDEFIQINVKDTV